MSKDKITDYSATASSNSDVGGINIATNCDFGNVDDALREILSHLAEMNAGTYPLADTVTFGDPADLTKKFRLDAGSITTASLRVITVPDRTGTMVLADGAQSLVSKTFADSSDTSKILAFALSGITTATTRTVTWPDSDGTVLLTTTFDTAKPTLATIEALSLVAGDTLYSTGADVIARLPKGTAAQVLTMNAGATAPEWQTPSVVTPASAPNAVLEDQKTAGTDGGTFTSGAWQTRTLNTEVYDPSGLMSLASNEFTPTVNGWVEWSASAYQAENHKTRLYNVTGAAIVGYGMSAQTDNAVNVTTTSDGGAAVTAGVTYRIEHRCTFTRATVGFGLAQGFGTEVYCRVKFWRS